MRLGAVYRTSIFGVSLCAANCFANAAPTNTDIPAVSAASVPAATRAASQEVSELLARVQAANEALYSSLQSFVCDEQIERFKGSLDGLNPQHLDTVTTKVSFENGTEHYSEILQDSQRLASLSSISGAWSEGEFGTLLQQTQILLATQRVIFRKYTDFDQTPVAIFGIEIPEQTSPWDLEVERHHYRVPFHTEVWVSRATGQIMKIERVSSAIPPQVLISEIHWSVTLQPVQLDQKSWLLPVSGTYAVLYRLSGRREWNDLSFSEYRRYGSEVALRFQ